LVVVVANITTIPCCHRITNISCCQLPSSILGTRDRRCLCQLLLRAPQRTHCLLRWQRR
jgi:hypothetical protein